MKVEGMVPSYLQIEGEAANKVNRKDCKWGKLRKCN